jgi:undecaprenyl diphosphate synthase
LLWQTAYTELYFTDLHWPDFDDAALAKALQWYGQRVRRFGRTDEQVQHSSAAEHTPTPDLVIQHGVKIG